jgi:hypothetical protein
MNTIERLRRMSAGDSIDRGLFWPDGTWPETRTRWLSEGMPPDMDFGFDVTDYRPDVEIGYIPPFKQETIVDEGDHMLILDMYGITRRVSKTVRSDIAQYVSFPVSDRTDWEHIRARLDASASGRFASNWHIKARAARSTGSPITIGGGHLCGFFSFLRELFGDEEVYYLLNDDPVLVREILSFQSSRMMEILATVIAEVPVDRLFIWEDMCYKNGPLIGPKLFEKFFMEPYIDLISLGRQLGVVVFDVDSDGKVDELIPLWIDAGVNMMHPFEVQSGMDVNVVLNEYDAPFVIRGGIDKRELAKGMDAIDREIDRIRPAYKTGRYIPTADHSIPPDVSFSDYQYYLAKRANLVGL